MSYAERREEVRAKVRSAAEARQRFLDMIYARQEAEEAKRLADEQKAERASKLNWFDDAAKGASMGSVAGPWGALVGAIAGTAKGQYESYKARGGGTRAFFDTLTDTPFGFTVSGGKSHGSLGGDTMGDLGMAFGNSKATYDRKKAAESTALADQQKGDLQHQRNLELARAYRGEPSYGQSVYGGSSYRRDEYPKTNNAPQWWDAYDYGA